MDENTHSDVVMRLRNAGHDVTWVVEDRPSSTDSNVLAKVVQEDRVLVTFDKEDFGNLVFAAGAEAQCGVVLFRFRDTSTPEQVDFMVGVLDTNAPWSGRFSVIRTGPTPTG